MREVELKDYLIKHDTRFREMFRNFMKENRIKKIIQTETERYGLPHKYIDYYQEFEL